MHRFAKLTTSVAGAMVLATLVLGLQQSVKASPPTQNTNSSTSRSIDSPQQPAAPPAQDFSKNTWNLPRDADKTKNPIEATEESIAQGKELFMTRTGNCILSRRDRLRQ